MWSDIDAVSIAVLSSPLLLLAIFWLAREKSGDASERNWRDGLARHSDQAIPRLSGDGTHS